ncbi:MAG: flagellar motor protein MotB [Thermodesulfovibrionales bacterium]
MAAKSSKIIIKKVNKGGHAGHHGGSWKVAYADFVTAMMAFFLLMWLLNMTSAEKRIKLSMYFKTFSLFEKGGTSMMLDKPGGTVGDSGGQFGKLDADKSAKGSTDDAPLPEAIKERISAEVKAKLSDVQDQIMVDLFEGGVRIQLVDKEGQSLFPVGASEMSPKAKKILGVIAENIKSLNNKIAIEGHTDALNYSTTRYTNWELSTERASAARKELEKNGLDPDRLMMVAGYASTAPLIKDNPNDPRNRRISIILVQPKGKSPSGPQLSAPPAVPQTGSQTVPPAPPRAPQ